MSILRRIRRELMNSYCVFEEQQFVLDLWMRFSKIRNPWG